MVAITQTCGLFVALAGLAGGDLEVRGILNSKQTMSSNVCYNCQWPGPLVISITVPANQITPPLHWTPSLQTNVPCFCVNICLHSHNKHPDILEICSVEMLRAPNTNLLHY